VEAMRSLQRTQPSLESVQLEAADDFRMSYIAFAEGGLGD